MLKKRPPKDVWLDEGLKILEDHGPSALTIDNLIKRTGKTKGSFYHHFKNRNEYVEALLNYFEMKGTIQILHEVDKESEQAARIRTLTRLVFQNSSKLELVIRSWSLYEPVVKKFQDRIDQKRLDHLNSIYVRSNADAASQAKMTALKNYAIYIGLQQLKHLYSEKKLKELIKGVFT